MDSMGLLSRVRALSDGELLSSLNGAVQTNRHAVADVIAHLGEVEERRLHLIGGYASLFAYCASRLGMSEDEAYRRIQVARLARRFPVLFARLAHGHISLSVAALLHPHLTDANHVALLDAVSGSTAQRAREVLAAWFPRPDVLPLIRKLPARNEQVVAHAPAPPDAGAASTETSPSVERVGPTPDRSPPIDLTAQPVVPTPAMTRVTKAPARAPSPLASRNVEPLSVDRYKLQLTASAALKRKLEHARDLLRHTIPNGDLARIVERALDVLLEQTMKRRFGAKASGLADQTAPSASEAAAPPAKPAPSPKPAPSARLAPSARPASHPGPTKPAPASSAACTRHVPNETRRAVFARDGARCAWQSPDGVRCNSRAWLEHDHIVPRGRGGGNDAANIRPFCRAHNQLAAEQAYGRDTIARIIARRRARRAPIQKDGHSCRVAGRMAVGARRENIGEHISKAPEHRMIEG